MPRIYLVTQDEILGHTFSRLLQHKLGYDLSLLAFLPQSVEEADIILYEASLKHPPETHGTAIRSIAQTVPIIALLKCNNVAYTESLIAAGAVDFLVIPCTLERLQTTIRNALALFYMRQNMEQWVEKRRVSGSHGFSNHQRFVSLCHEDGKLKRLKDIETEIIAHVLSLQHGCLARTAKSLGIGRTTLYRKLKQSIHQSKEAVQALNPVIQDNIGYLQHPVTVQEV